MTPFRHFRPAAGLFLAFLAAGCAKEERPTGGEAAAAQAVEPALTVEQMERLSPSAAAVDAFNAVCAAEPARTRVSRAAARRGFKPVPLAALREEMPGAALPADADAWRGPEEAAGAVVLWDEATATCELRARNVDPLVVAAEFAKLPQALEEAGASVMRLQAPPARAGGPRTSQMLLVSPGGAPERARVLRFGDDGSGQRDAVVMSARGVTSGSR
jgi:hypothetical protein